MSPLPDLALSFCLPRSTAVKRSLEHEEDNFKKMPKLEDDTRNQVENTKNVVEIMAVQDLKNEAKAAPNKPKKKPKTPAERVLVSLGGEVGCGEVLKNLLSKSHRKSSDALAAFILFVYERQIIFELKSSGAEPPYTKNEVMKSKWFTNMYREVDRGTIFFRKQILAEHELLPSYYKEVVFKTFVYRLINKIETFEEFGKIPCIEEWKTFRKFLKKKMSDGGVIFTSAHINMGLDRFCDTIEEILKQIDTLTQSIVEVESLEGCFYLLKDIKNIGPFFAWQLCCDFLELKLNEKFDENSWTCLGPGAKAGLRRIFDAKSGKDELPLTLRLTQIMDNGFRALGLEFPYFLQRKLTLKNVEHALCEYDKYFRAASKQPTRERIFYSRSSLDSTICMVCTMTCVTTCTRCVLCGSSYHPSCLGSDLEAGWVGDKWWLCQKCHKLEDRGKVYVYEEVKQKFKIKPFTITMVKIDAL